MCVVVVALVVACRDPSLSLYQVDMYTSRHVNGSGTNNGSVLLRRFNDCRTSNGVTAEP